MAPILNVNAIHRLIANRLDEKTLAGKALAGIVGDSPSRYSKSPALWNAAFRHLGINANYVPFDVDEVHLGDLLQVLKDSERFLGLNVTVPHKVRVIDFLDDLDPGAARIQAVNTVVRSPTGKLTGYNTDGEGFVDSLLLPTPEHPEGFLPSLDGVDVLLLGAGGSARAVAFHVSDHIGKGKLVISNRTLAHAQSLAEEIAKLGRQTIAIDEDDVSLWAPKVGLIVNTTTKGQGGVRKLNNGMATLLAPYSALAPAQSPLLPESLGDGFEKQWRAVAGKDIETNNRSSESLAATIPAATRFYDLIYHPEETVFLRHGRETGHRTMNGKSMIVCQAVSAFQKICRQQLQSFGKVTPALQRELAEVMFANW